MEIKICKDKYTELLSNLKMCVEASSYTTTKINFYALQKVHIAVMDIMEHGLLYTKQNGKPDLWVFVQGLSWIQPTLAASPSFFGDSNSYVLSPIKSTDKAINWVYSSLYNNNLSDKLSWLLSDHMHLNACYHKNAFLRQVEYSDAVLICLKAFEQSEMSLLSKIEHCLYFKKNLLMNTHRRCSSFPEPKSNISTKTLSNVTNKIQELIKFTDNESSSHLDCYGTKVLSTIEDENNILNQKMSNINFECVRDVTEEDTTKEKMLNKCLSSSDISLLSEVKIHNSDNIDDEEVDASSLFVNASCTENQLSDSSILNDLLSTSMQNGYNNDKFEKEEFSTTMSNCDSVVSIKSKYGCTKRSPFFDSPYKYPLHTEDDSSGSGDSKTLVHVPANSKKSLINHDRNFTLPMSTGTFPVPSPGQSIISFLSSGAFTNMTAELDRENAHFNISEAVISILEQVKFNEQIRNMKFECYTEDSDEEVTSVKKKRLKKRVIKKLTNIEENDDTTTTTDQSVNSLSSSLCSTSGSISTDQDEGNLNKKISSVRNALSISKSSLFSDEMNDFGRDISASAENVAISLIRKFNECQLPAASDIEWLVSEKDAPQKILPLSNSISVDSPEFQSDVKTTLLGNLEWAPPRPQIIFTPHPPPVRNVVMRKQRNRCAGCGTVVAQKYVSKFRYCEYLGKYFCPGCHVQETSLIPGKIIQKWDFKKFYVSNFSYKIIDQMMEDPLFNVLDLNENLYKRHRELNRVHLLRLSLFYIKDFIFSCKYAERLKSMILVESDHIYRDPHCYSLADFIRVKNGKLQKSLTTIVNNCETHVQHCTLCQARGFMCEICNKQELIFPWEVYKVNRCVDCGSCHHIKCIQRKRACPKCIRINNRNDLHKIGAANSIIS